MLPKNKANLFVTNTEHTYFGQKQDKVILEKTGQWTKTEQTYLDKTWQTYFGQKQNKIILDITGQAYLWLSFRDSNVSKPRRNKK